MDDALSSIYSLENGTAQGSIISPLLFLIMINDLPDVLVNIESSLIADDNAVFKSGKTSSSLHNRFKQISISLRSGVISGI